jgi:hypothetical protein
MVEPALTPAQIELLGRLTDVEVGRRLGRTAGAICQWRKKLGISALANPNCRPWTKHEVVLLGTMSDAAVAAKLGRSVGATKMKRQSLGISPAHSIT